MAEIITFSVPNNNINSFNKFKELKWQERTSVSDLVLKACLEYLENHKGGNPNYKLEKWADPDFLAVPAYMAPESNWQEFYKKMRPQMYKKIDDRLNWFLRVHNGKKM